MIIIIMMIMHIINRMLIIMLILILILTMIIMIMIIVIVVQMIGPYPLGEEAEDHCCWLGLPLDLQLAIVYCDLM